MPWFAVKMEAVMYSKSFVHSVISQQTGIFIRLLPPPSPLQDPPHVTQIASAPLLTFDVLVPVRALCVLFDWLCNNFQEKLHYGYV